VAYEQRLPVDYFYGTLAVAAAISDTTLSAVAFAGLGTGYSSTTYTPLVLHDPAAGVREVVWVTAHTAAAQTVTVMRGREGTSAVAWPAGTQIVCAPTAARDGVIHTTLAALPTDGHYNARAVATDQGTAGLPLVRTGVGWAPASGVALASQTGPLVGRASTYPPADATVLVRAGYFEGNSDASGNVHVGFRLPFANDIVSFVATSTVLNTLGPFVVYVYSTSGVSVRCYNGTTLSASAVVRFSFVAIGY
jgi:hypothetical protein